MSIPDFKVPVTRILEPLQQLGEFLGEFAPLTVDNGNISIPAIIPAAVSVTVTNINSASGNLSTIGFANAAANQVYIGSQNLGAGATSGADFFIAINPIGGSAPIERWRISSEGVITVGPLGALTDGSSWALSQYRYTQNLDPSNGKYYLMNLQPYATAVSGSVTSYEKAGLIIQAKTNDPSTGGIDRDMVALDARSTIVATNPSGRAYAINAQGIILAGGDGLSYAIECGVVNGGTDQPLVDTTTSKYGVQITVGGNGASAGLKFIGSGGGFHKVIYANPADILGTHANDAFIELLSTWKVKKDGSTGIGTGTPLYRTHILGANASPSLSAVGGIVAIDGGALSNQLAIGTYSGSPFGVWLQAKDNLISGAGSGTAYPMALNPLGGNVGIGTNNPQAKLEVKGDVGQIRLNFPTSTSFAQFSLAEGGVQKAVIGMMGSAFISPDRRSALEFITFGGPIDFWPNAVFGARITTTGNFGIGTDATVSARLHSLSTTEQLRLGYDAANYVPFTVSNVGNMTMAPSGGVFTVTGNQIVSGTMAAGFLLSASLTNGRVPIVSSAGLLADDSDLTWSGGDTLTSTKVVGSTYLLTPLLTASANINIAPTNNVGFWTTTFGTGAVKNIVIANGLVPTSAYVTGTVRLTVEDVVNNMAGIQPNGIAFGHPLGTRGETLGSQVVVEAKGLQVRCHSSFGSDARVDLTTGAGDYPSVLMTLRKYWTGDFDAPDPIISGILAPAKRANLASNMLLIPTAGLATTNEVINGRFYTVDSGTGTHLGKFYSVDATFDDGSTGSKASVRGLMGQLNKYSSATFTDSIAILGLYRVQAAGSGTVTTGEAGHFELWQEGTANFAFGNVLRTQFRNSGASAHGTIRNLRVSTPVISAGTITELLGLSVGDLSGLLGVTNAFNIESEGANSQNAFVGACLFGGRPLEADSATQFGLLQGQAAYGFASTNISGGDIALTGGFGRKFYSVLDIASGNVTLTTTVNGTSVILTGSAAAGGGIDFVYGASSTTAAAALAVAINGNTTLNTKVFAVASGASVYLRRRGSLYSLVLATSNAARTSFTSSLNGKIWVPDTPGATANFGLVSLGAAPFDGTTSGFFVGNAGGTHLAFNALSTFTGNYIDMQQIGVSKFIVTAAGSVGIGKTVPEATLHIVDVQNESLFVDKYIASAVGPGFKARKARGTIAAPRRAKTTDSLGSFNAFGSYATDDSTDSVFPATGSGRFQFLAAEDFTLTARGTYWILATTPIGSVTAAERLRVTDAGSVIIGTAALATTATDGFLYIPTCAGPPTGIPTPATGRVPWIYDTVNNHLYVGNGGWKKTTVFA